MSQVRVRRCAQAQTSPVALIECSWTRLSGLGALRPHPGGPFGGARPTTVEQLAELPRELRAAALASSVLGLVAYVPPARRTGGTLRSDPHGSGASTIDAPALFTG